MFRRILVATDGSAHALNAARQAGIMARSLSASVTLVHVVTNTVPPTTVAVTPRAAGQEILARARAHLQAPDVPQEEELLEGNPALALLEYAKRGDFDLIVMGSRRLSGTRRLLLGSVSRVVADRAPCSVLIVRPTQPDPPLPDALGGVR